MREPPKPCRLRDSVTGDHVRSLASLGNHLIMNPAVGALQAVAQAGGRFPLVNLLNEAVVAVAAVHAFWRGEIVAALQFHPGDALDDVDELIDTHQFATTKIQRIRAVTFHDHLRSLHAVIDPHEAARLMSVAPDLN